MNVWLVPIRPRSWRVIKKTGIFGLPSMDYRARIGDLVIFHVLKPVNGVVAVGRTISNTFEDHTDLWGPDKYPFRFRVEIVFDCSEFGGKAVPLTVIYGGTDDPDISIEPFFQNVWITKVSKQQFERLRQHLLSINCKI